MDDLSWFGAFGPSWKRSSIGVLRLPLLTAGARALPSGPAGLFRFHGLLFFRGRLPSSPSSVANSRKSFSCLFVSFLGTSILNRIR